MKRGLAFALAALALVAGNVAVNAADIDLSLNLRYTHPNKPELGGQWFLMAKNTLAGANTGIAGLNLYLTNISSTGIVWGNPTAVGSYPVVTKATLGANVDTVGGTPFVSTTAGVTNIVYGQDLVTKVFSVGEGSGTAAATGNVAVDPLRNTAWNNSTLVMSGTFAGGGNAGNKFNRPEFSAGSDGTVYTTTGTIPASNTISAVVRGDSLASKGLNTPANAGLQLGDKDRSFGVNLNTDIFPALAFIGTGPGKTWDQGDFNGDGQVNLNTDIFPSLANIGVAPVSPVSVAAVPEPTSFALLGMVAGAATMLVRKRR